MIIFLSDDEGGFHFGYVETDPKDAFLRNFKGELLDGEIEFEEDLELAGGGLSDAVYLLLEIYGLERLVAVNIFMGESVFFLISASQEDVYFIFILFAVVEGYKYPVFQLVILYFLHDPGDLLVALQGLDCYLIFDGLLYEPPLEDFLVCSSENPCEIFLAGMGEQFLLLAIDTALFVLLVDEFDNIFGPLLAVVDEVALVGVLLVGPLVLAEHVDEVHYILVLLVGDPGLYFVQLYIALEQIFVLITVLAAISISSFLGAGVVVESFFKGVDILFEVGFEGDGEDVVEAIEVILVVHILGVGSDVANPIELVGYFCGGSV